MLLSLEEVMISLELIEAKQEEEELVGTKKTLLLESEEGLLL